tara:strand:- start:96 stop:266 length:171 start_codon:yes stop_codon:yes gene_type:complete
MNLANSGGEAKQLIKSGSIKVNAEIETRNKKKLVAGDVVEFEGTNFIVKEEHCQQS